MKRHFNGYMGRILRVDVTTGKTATEVLSEKMIKMFIGGRGFGAKLLFDELKPGVDPLSPENKLIFSNGPLTNTLAISCSRWIVSTKSPQTGTIFRACAGGSFGAELKKAGYDVLIVEGKADKPVYLWITDDRVELRDATNLVGLLTDDTAAAIRTEFGDQKIKVATVGPAAEKFVRYAAIVDDRRTASRGGVGTVMWSKNLKAIAVRGNRRVEVADRERLQELSKMQAHIIQTDNNCKYFSRLGSASAVPIVSQFGIYPVRNFQDSVLDGVEEIGADNVEKILVKDVHCHNCSIHCGNIVQMAEGPYAGNEVEGPEYETMYSFGGMVGNTNLGMIIEANRICDDYGIDTITAGSSIAFAMELYEKGILSTQDADGLDLTWGNHQAVIELLKKIVAREGIGDMLAEGTRRAAQHIGKGSEQYAMQVKGLEISGYDPRGLKALSVNYATSNIGAAHTTGMGGFEDRLIPAGKGKACKKNQDTHSIYDSCINCIFPVQYRTLGLDNLTQLLPAATGIDEFSDGNYLLQAGERIWNIERAFNAREGFDRKDDTLPPRFLQEPHPSGPVKGSVVELAQMLDDYYEERGWDARTGKIKRKKLEEISLTAVANELERLQQ